MTTRKYSSRSQQTTLTAGINSSDTSATVVSGTALLGGVTISAGQTFTVVIDPDTAIEEIVDVTAVSTNTLTITRGIDGSSGQSHSAGAVVRHMAIGRDYREANTHIEASSGVHGLTGSVVGTTDTQTLTNKTLTNPTVSGLYLSDSSITFEGSTNDAFETTITVTDPTADRTITIPNVTGTVVTTGDTGSVTTTMIADSTITNNDISASAAIDKTKIAGTAVTLTDTGTVTSTMIADGTITNSDINASAGIAYSKLNLTGSITSSDIVDGTITNADISATAAIANSKLATNPLARANHTGTQTASTISDFDTQVRTSRLDQMAAPTADVSLNTYKITGLATPTASTDASTKGYVDTQITNLIGTSPSTLDTLGEIAAAINSDPNLYTTLNNGKLNRDGTQAMTGALNMGTNKITNLVDPTNAQEAATKNYVDTGAASQVAAAAASATAAATSASNASTSATNAASSATAASSSANTASTQASNASTSASNAATSATNAASSATSAANSATTATTQASNAATSASNALTYSNNASSSASAAATSATAAQTAQTAAETAYDSFDDRYLGAKASAPTLDNDGNALLTGALYFNTVANKMYVYNGSTWQEQVGTVSLTRWRKTVAGGETSLSGNDDNSVSLTYNPGYETVYLNGVLLVRDDDYTATTGTSITGLSPALAASDVVEVFSYSQFNVSNAISLTTIDAKGDLLVGSANDTVGRLAAGTNDFVLTADSTQALGLKWAAVTPSLDLTLNAQTGTTYTLVLTDKNKLITASNASAITITIPTNATAAFATGAQVHIVQTGAGQVTVQGASGVTVNSTGATATAPKARVQYSSLTCIKTATDTWLVIGDIA